MSSKEKFPIDNPDSSDADTIQNMLTVGLGINKSSTDPQERLAAIGLKNVARDYTSKDLTDKAKAIRTMKGLLRGNNPETSFEATTRSPEEMKAGLVRLLAGFKGAQADHIRKRYGIPEPAEDNERVTSVSIFKPEQEPVVLSLIQLGLSVSKEAEQKHKVITPEFMWSNKHIEALTETLTETGTIRGSHEHRLSQVNGAKDELLLHLDWAVKANERITDNLQAETLSKLPVS